MATGPVESLSPSFDLNGGIMSDSGILLCSNDIENLIVNEIERIKGSRQRADTISVCKALSKKHSLSESVVVIAIDFMMKHDKLKKTLYAGRESFSIVDRTGINEGSEELQKRVEKGTGERTSLDEDNMTEKDKEHEKVSPRVSNGAMALEFRGELVRQSLEVDGEGKSENENEDETSETEKFEESEGSICSSSIVFQDNTSNRLEMLESHLTLVLKRLVKLEEKDGNKNKNMDLPFNHILDRLCFLERENQSLQVENEKLKTDNLKRKESKIGKDLKNHTKIPKMYHAKGLVCLQMKILQKKHYQIKKIKGRCAQENYQILPQWR